MPRSDAERTAGEAGFTLLEALVALAILAVASGGLLRAAEAHVDRVGVLEQRAAAEWAAEAVLTDIRTGRVSVQAASGPQEMAGRSFDVRVEAVATDDPELVRADVVVRAGRGDQELARLTGFVDLGANR